MRRANTLNGRGLRGCRRRLRSGRRGTRCSEEDGDGPAWRPFRRGRRSRCDRDARDRSARARRRRDNTRRRLEPADSRTADAERVRGGRLARSGALVGRLAGFRFWFPTYDRFARGAYFIDPRYASQVRRLQDDLRVFFHLVGDVDESVDEQIELLFAFGFGRLNHHGAVHDQREADGVGMKAVIDEPLRDVACTDAFLRLAIVTEDALVHGRALIGKLVVRLQHFADVGGVEDGVHSCVAKSWPAVGHDVGEGSDEDTEVAVEGSDAADGLWKRIIPGVVRSSFVVRRSSLEAGNRQEWLEVSFDCYRTGAGAAAAVGSRERLVQVEVHHIDAEIARAGDADQRV